MSKRTTFLFFLIIIVSIMPLPQAEALGIGPPSIELDLPMNGSNSTTIYFDSEGVEGKLVISKENLPFRIEPSIINMSKEDNYRSFELTFYGNETLEPGVYEGKVTFVAQTGGFVAVGIKIRAKINLLEDVVLINEVAELYKDTPSISIDEEKAVEIHGDKAAPQTEENSIAGIDYIPYVMGGAVVAVLASAVIWWKRNEREA